MSESFGRYALFSRRLALWLGFGSDGQGVSAVNSNRPLHFYVKDIAEENVTFSTLNRNNVAPIIEMIRSEAAVIDVRHDIDSRSRDGYILIDVDSYGLIDDIISQLVDLRVRMPLLRVILLSRGFARDDFSTERLAVCDVSLRLPVSIVRLELAFVCADENNRLWQNRFPVDAPEKICSDQVAKVAAPASGRSSFARSVDQSSEVGLLRL